jgi:hypothetical protein
MQSRFRPSWQYSWEPEQGFSSCPACCSLVARVIHCPAGNRETWENWKFVHVKCQKNRVFWHAAIKFLKSSSFGCIILRKLDPFNFWPQLAYSVVSIWNKHPSYHGHILGAPCRDSPLLHPTSSQVVYCEGRVAKRYGEKDAKAHVRKKAARTWGSRSANVVACGMWKGMKQQVR